MFYGRLCIGGVHCLQDGIFFNILCFTGGHVLLEGMCYSRTHVVVAVMSSMRICVRGGYV